MTVDYQFDLGPGCEPGVPVALAPGIRRVIADNPSPMTFTGTATYLVGEGSVALIDPGPRQAGHIDRILKTIREGERIEAIFVTHRHLDHSPGTRLLCARTNAPVYAARPQDSPYGAPPPALLAAEPGGGEGIDPEFTPDHILEDGDLVESASRNGGQPAWSLRAVLTPGHLDDHVCFSSERDGALFTGDHAMGWSSTMVSPPEGDSGTYMESLRRLARRADEGQDRMYYPGHGHPVANPAALVDHLLRRREQRNEQILAALAAGPQDFEGLMKRGYRGLRGIQALAARRMLLAHLIHLERHSRIRLESDVNGAVRFAPGEGVTSAGYNSRARS